MPPDATGTKRDGFTVDWSDLAPRIASAVVLVVGALATAYEGLWFFAAFWGAAAAVVVFEWLRLVAPADLSRRATLQVLGMLVLAGTATLGHWQGATMLLAAMTAIAAALATGTAGRLLDAAGILYAAALIVGPVAIRQSATLGLLAIIWLFAIVWATDVFAYFAGKSIGGPKLWPRVSPKKTWAGFVGGTMGGIGAAILTLAIAGKSIVPMSFVAAGIVAIASQAGDLFESALKRRFNVKDTGNIIPGHGGLMDRLDGFIVAVIVALLMGSLHLPFDPARGMLVW